MANRTARVCVLLFCVSAAVFLVRIQFPRGMSFDEVMYVPEARLVATGDGFPNLAHPPLAQFMIALGIRVFGDTTFGWRFMSAVFGAITIVGSYCWGLALFRRHETALWIALITLVNQMVFVMARTAMLDIFLSAFLIWGIAAFCEAWRADVAPKRARRMLLICGAMFGFATACKWLGIVAIGAAVGLIVAEKAAREFARSDDADSWIAAGTLRDVGFGTIAMAFVVVPFAFYFAAHLPLLALPGSHGVWRTFAQYQWEIWHNHTTVPASPAILSSWYQWPINVKPIWFAFEREGVNVGRAVQLTGNVIVMWAGLAGVAVCAWSWIAKRSRAAFLVTAWWAALLLSWAVLPIRTGFLYYYLPALLMLGGALAYFSERWPREIFGIEWRWWLFAAAATVFVFKLPVLSAMRVPLEWLPF